MRKIVICLLLLAVASGAFAEEVVNRIAAVVDDEVITLYEVETLASPIIAKLIRSNPDMSAEELNREAGKIKYNVMRGLIEQKLIEREVARLGIEVTEGEINAYIERIKKANNYTDDSLRMALARQGISMQEFRDRIKNEILSEQYVSFRMRDKLRVRDEDIRAYYENHRDEFAAEPVVRIAEIRLNVAPDATEDDIRATFARANEVYEKLLAGGDFAQLAAEYSQGPTAHDGGVLGNFKMETELNSLYRRALTPLQVGQHSTIFRDKRGFFILKLLTKNQEGLQPFEQVRDRIRMILRKQKADLEMQRLAAELYKKSYVDIRVHFIEE